MTKSYRVTAKGIANVNPDVKLTAVLIGLVDGTDGVAWTMQATHHDNPPLDDEGWAPWENDLTVHDLLKLGYIVEVVCK